MYIQHIEVRNQLLGSDLAAVILLGGLGGELLTRFIPEMVLRKVAAVLLLDMGLLMWLEKPQSEKRICLEFRRRVS